MPHSRVGYSSRDGTCDARGRRRYVASFAPTTTWYILPANSDAEIEAPCVVDITYNHGRGRMHPGGVQGRLIYIVPVPAGLETDDVVYIERTLARFRSSSEGHPAPEADCSMLDVWRT